MTSPSIVRPAVPADRDEIWRLFKLHHEENGLFPLAESKVRFYLDRMLNPHDIEPGDMGPRGMIGVIGPIGALEGGIMLVLGSPWYTEDVTLDDCMNFVDPAHRKSRHSEALIEYSKHLVDKVREGHPEFKMILGIVSTKRTAAKIRLYSRRMPVVGAYFMYPAPAEVECELKVLGKEIDMQVPAPAKRKRYRPPLHERRRMKALQSMQAE